MNHKRNDCFDAAKAYLILLVIVGHVMIVLNPSYDKKLLVMGQEFIYTFHISAFFFLHGALCNKDKWKNASVGTYIKKRFVSLVVPYIFFETIGIICHFVFLKQSIKEGVWNLITIRCNVGADWFLIAMFLGALLFLGYIKHPNKIYGLISVILCLILPVFLGKTGFQFSIVLGRAFLAYAFMMIGSFLHNIILEEKYNKPVWILFSFLITTFCAIVNLKLGGNDYYGCVVNNPLTFLIGGISGTVMIIGIARLLHAKWVCAIGRHTLTIMGTHQLVIYALTALIPGLYGGTMLMGAALLLAIVCFELPVVFLLDRYLPFMVGRTPSK